MSSRRIRQSTPSSSSGSQRRGADELRLDRDRAQVRVQPEAAAEREQGLLGADRGVGVVPLRARRRRRGARRPRRGTPPRPRAGRRCRRRRSPRRRRASSSHANAEAEPAADGLEDGDRRRDDLRPDAVARDQRDPVRHGCHPRRRRVREAGIRHGSSSAVRRPTNATSMPLISAPWSLLIAVRYASSDASMMLVLRPVAGDDERPGALVGRAAAAHEHLALGVLAGGDGLDLVLGQHRRPVEDRADRLVDGLEQRVDGAVAGLVGSLRLARDDERDGAHGVPAGRRADAPAEELDRSRARRLLRSFDERQQVRVGDLLLRVGEGDRRAVDRVELLALDVVRPAP